MKRRTLDIMFSVGGFFLAGVLVVIGLVLTSNANFAEDYVTDQLSAEKIEFAAVEDLTPQDKAYSKERTGCLFDYAGQALSTGKHAECYANEYIGAHLSYLPTRLGYTSVAWADGLTYRELGGELGKLNEQIAAAKEAKDPELPQLEQQLADLTTVRTKAFEGSMLRNALLTSFGFSVLGEKTGQAATYAYIVAAILALLSIAGSVHAFRTPKSVAFAPVEGSVRVDDKIERELVAAGM